MRVRVYRNLHTGTLSMQAYNKDKKGWRVIAHPTVVMLKDVKFTVREAGRLRVLKENRKNVHAWIEGELRDMKPGCYIATAWYNPYKTEFWTGLEGQKLEDCSFCCVDATSGVTYAPTKWHSV